MIANTNTGVLIAGALAKDPELRHVGQYGRAVLKTSVRYANEKDEQGKNRGKFLDVDLWDSAEELDGMFAKGDAVIVAGELKDREYNGKTYHFVNAIGIFPSGAVTFRWMQQAIDLVTAAAPPAPVNTPAGFEPVAEPAPFDDSAPLAGHEIYPGEQPEDHIPGVTKMVADEAPGTDFIAGEPEDLPF